MSQQEPQQTDEDAPTVEELAERVEEIERKLDPDASGVVGALWGRRQMMEKLLLGEDRHFPENAENESPILERLERLDELEARLERLEQRSDPAALDYEQMSRRQKVARLREHLVEQAQQRGGRFAMGYKEVIALFDGHPSPGTAYNLMEAAGEKDGFSYKQPRNGNKRIGVNLGGLNDATLLSGGEE